MDGTAKKNPVQPQGHREEAGMMENRPEAEIVKADHRSGWGGGGGWGKRGSSSGNHFKLEKVTYKKK